MDLKIWKNGDHTQEDLTKSGYNEDMEYKYLINLLYLWLKIENQICKEYIFSLLVIENWKIPKKIHC